MKLLLKSLLLSFIVSAIASCTTDDLASSNPEATFKANLSDGSGASATSKATETVILSFDTITKTFSLTGITADYGYISKGSVEADEPPVFILSDLNTRMTYKSAPLSATQEADLNANMYYISLYSSAFPKVQISGQLIKQVLGSDAPPAPAPTPAPAPAPAPSLPPAPPGN